MKTRRITVIRVNGTVEEHNVPADSIFSEVERLINAQCLDHVTFSDKVLWVDDIGIAKNLPVNPEASKMYQSKCRPEVRSTCFLYGDAAITYESDFPEEE